MWVRGRHQKSDINKNNRFRLHMYALHMRSLLYKRSFFVNEVKPSPVEAGSFYLSHNDMNPDPTKIPPENLTKMSILYEKKLHSNKKKSTSQKNKVSCWINACSGSKHHKNSLDNRPKSLYWLQWHLTSLSWQIQRLQIKPQCLK